MLDLTKSVLEKVRFDKGLFLKELYKSLNWLKRPEIIALKAWCLATFTEYQSEIQEAFKAFS